MQIELITQDRYQTSVWSGGETTELFILPPGASYSKRNFSARISSATVTLDRSVFTSLPGIMRYLSPLDGELTLRVDGNTPIRLRPGEIIRFDGGASVECEGRGRDLNLMLRNCAGNMLYQNAISLMDQQDAFIYAHNPLMLRAGQENISVPQGCLLRISPDTGETVEVYANEAFYVFLIDHALGDPLR